MSTFNKTILRNKLTTFAVISTVHNGLQTHLVNDIDAIAELLTLQEGMQVVEQELEVVLPISVGNDYCSAVASLTVWRPIAPSTDNKWILPLHLGKRKSRGKSDMNWST